MPTRKNPMRLFRVKPKTLPIRVALFLILCAPWSFAQTPRTELRHRAAPTPQKTVLAAVKIGDKWGYIDKTGKFVIPPQFPHAESFSEGLALVLVGDKYGYIDNIGKTVIPPQFSHASSFSEGLAAVRVGDKDGYIDKTGRMAIQPQFVGASKFSE